MDRPSCNIIAQYLSPANHDLYFTNRQILPPLFWCTRVFNPRIRHLNPLLSCARNRSPELIYHFWLDIRIRVLAKGRRFGHSGYRRTRRNEESVAESRPGGEGIRCDRWMRMLVVKQQSKSKCPAHAITREMDCFRCA
jgi:hypothetical protein